LVTGRRLYAGEALAWRLVTRYTAPSMHNELSTETTQSPDESLLTLSMGIWTGSALSAAAALGIADQLASGPKTRDELAAATRTHARSLYRVLRALASLGVFAERPDGRFENTPASEKLRSDLPGSLRDYIIFIGQPWHVAAYGELMHSIRTGEPVVGKVLGKPIWDFFATNKEQGRIFDAAMTSIIADTAFAVRDAYDFSSTRTLVDVGGGHRQVVEQGRSSPARPALHWEQAVGRAFLRPRWISRHRIGPSVRAFGCQQTVTGFVSHHEGRES
jgi:hypothetical protein